MKRITLLRGLGSNIGDYAILDGTINALRKIGCNVDSIIDPEPIYLDPFFCEWNITPFKSSQSIIESLIQTKNKNEYFGKKSFYFNLIDEDINYLFAVGGSRFGGYPNILGSLEINNTLIKKRILNLDLVLGGISVDGVSNNFIYNKYYKYFLNNVKYAFVRDLNSYQALTSQNKRLNVELIIDFAYHSKIENLNKNIYCNRIVFIGRNLSKYFHYNHYQENISKICKFLSNIDSKEKIIFLSTTKLPYKIPGYTDDDFSMYLDIKRSIGDRIEYLDNTTVDIRDIFSTIQNSKAVISMRMHGSIFGTIFNKPVINIYQENKSYNFFNTFFKNDVVQIRYPDLLMEPVKNASAINQQILTMNPDNENKIKQYKEESMEKIKKIM